MQTGKKQDLTLLFASLRALTTLYAENKINGDAIKALVKEKT